MPGAKKKKTKPAANPTRGFATTSVASKPRVEVSKTSETADDTSSKTDEPSNPKPSAASKLTPDNGTSSKPANAKEELTPEEFERQLEESELQLLVEKHGAKVKREAQRQRTRLDIDKRLLRGQAEGLNTKGWLHPELIREVLELIQSEDRTARSVGGSATEGAAGNKRLSEEDLVMRLWTLRLALSGTIFGEEKVSAVVRHILDIAPSVTVGNKEAIWGLDETLDWLAKECSSEELPGYDTQAVPSRTKPDTWSGSPGTSGTNTPLLAEFNRPRPDTVVKKAAQKAARLSKTQLPAEDLDLDAEDLLPTWLKTKEELFKLSQPELRTVAGSKEPVANEHGRLQARLERIEGDVLFDKYPAEQQWQARRIILQREAAETRKRAAEERSSTEDSSTGSEVQDRSINAEADKIAAEILAETDDSDNDAILADLFASLPTNEVDPDTGKSTTVVNDKDGKKVTFRDFGKPSGVDPSRILEEACRSRDAGVKISYRLVSEAAFANRHAVSIVWSKSQELPAMLESEEIEAEAVPTHFAFKMSAVATPDATQSKAYIATIALFYISSNSAKDEKLGLRLPPGWKGLWDELEANRQEKADAADRIVVRELREIVRQKREEELEDGIVLQGAFKARSAARSGTSTPDPMRDPTKRLSADPEQFRRIWAEKSGTRKFQTMLTQRMQLPMWAFKSQVLQAVDSHQVVIVCGETGCGKSTQVPSFLLEHALSSGRPCKIYCTEPRRISAISLAKRVSEELGEERGDVGTNRSLIGYSIRLEANTSRETRLVYATTGIVLRMLEASTDLSEITHLVLDEVHERSIDSDFLLIVLKKLMEKRKDLRVVLMSATVDAEKFSKYLEGAPVLQVPGRTYPVRAQYLEDAVQLTGYTTDTKHVEKMVDLDDDIVELEPSGTSSDEVKSLTGYSAKTRASVAALDHYRIEFDLIVQLVGRVATDADLMRYSSATLIFLPGIAEIRTLNDLFLGDKFFSGGGWLIYPLHSTIATEEQEAAFLVPPPGVRKIVLATNIAETGITIPDVTCVIDTGKHREMRFDERRQLSRLVDTFISRANAKQRRGRAGRVQEGICFHLFTKYRHDHLMSDSQTPEMLRLSLQDLAMRVKICKIGGIEETLAQALDAPSAKNIRRAVDALIDVRALTPAEDLTPLGIQLARLPLDVFLGKLILLGTIFKCLDMAVTVSAILSSKSPFVAPFGQRAQADTIRLGFRRGDSDLLTVYNAYLAWKRVCQSAVGAGQEFQFTRKNFLSPQTLSNIEDLKGQLIVALVDSGFLPLTDEERRTLRSMRSQAGSRRRHQTFFELPQRVNLFSENDDITQSVIAWALYPKLLVRDVAGGKGLRNVGNNQAISLHPSSVNRGHTELHWLSYYHIMQSKSKVYHAHETTGVDAFPIALLCGDVRVDMYAGVLILDGNRARFSVTDWKTLLLIKVLRTRLREVLTRSFKTPGKGLTAQHERWLGIWQRIFLREDFKESAGATAASVRLG